MKVVNLIKGANPTYPEPLSELFKAMEAGHTISSITCVESADQERTLNNFTASEYFPQVGRTKQGTSHDLVRNGTTSFYMDNVIDYTL